MRKALQFVIRLTEIHTGNDVFHISDEHPIPGAIETV